MWRLRLLKGKGLLGRTLGRSDLTLLNSVGKDDAEDGVGGSCGIKKNTSGISSKI